MRKLIILIAAIFLPLASMHACAAELQSLDDVALAVERFVRQKTADIPGEVSIAVSRPDARLRLGKCGQLETWLPSGNRLWGRASVGVRCTTPAWSMYVPVTVKVTGNALVTLRPVSPGQVLTAEDVVLQSRDLTQFPGGLYDHVEQVVGKTAAASIKADTLVRPEMLRSPLAIKQGQQVILVAQGSGFKVSSEGQAMGNAAIGQVVTVKTRSGQTIKGIAKGDGVVEVYF